MLSAVATLRPLLVRLVAGASLALAAGCATSYPVKIEAASAGRPSPGLAYRIEFKGTGSDGVARLREAEAAGYVRTALSGRGFYEAPSAARADVVIEVEFGVEPVRGEGGPDRLPIYAEVAGGVREETVTTTGPDGKTTTETVRVAVPPRREVIGYQQLVDAVPVYRKFLRVQAREARPQEKDGVTRDLWSVRATSEDRSDDLRRYLPVLASVTMRSLAGEVGSGEVRVAEDDPDVAFVRRGL
ncbi:MAG: hypothetical protein FJ382_04705 [Verrucomicrobia bacterium]|nr:hypothetical protein [Verrucomicrobiota bacterium]